MIFTRSNNKTKQLYYQIFILIELSLLILLYYIEIHWAILLLATPIILIDAWSNLRCSNRQKKHIQKIEVNDDGIKCYLANKTEEFIPKEKSLFSIREEKFEKDKTEIEVRRKGTIKSRLVGRLHILNWNQILEIKSELLKNKITQIKYRPEGYWSKYGTLTADVVITGTALATAEIADLAGDLITADNLRTDGIMPLQELKDNEKQQNQKS